MENDSIELENSKNLHSYENKEYSSEDNPKNVENHLNILTTEITYLKEQNLRLKSKLNVSLHDKEKNLKTHTKEILKFQKENKHLKEEFLSENKLYQRENQKIKEELKKIKKSYKKFLNASENKIIKLENEIKEVKHKNLQILLRKDKEISV